MTSQPFQAQTALEHTYEGEHPLQTLLYLYSGQWGRMALAALLFLIKHSPVWAMPLLTARIIDQVAAGGPGALPELWRTAALLAAFLLQNIPVAYLYVRQLSLAVRRMGTQLRSAIVRRLQQLSIDYYKRQSAGRLQNKVLRDVESIDELTRALYDSGLAAASGLIVTLTVTSLRAPAFLLIFAVAVPVAVLVLRGLRGALARRNTRFRLELERMSVRVNEMTHLIPITRAHGLEEDEIRRMDATLSEVQQAGLQLDFTTGLFNATGWVTFNLFNVACLVFTAWAYLTRFIPISLGDIVLLTGYFNALTNSVMALINLTPQLARGSEAIRSIGEVLQSPDLEQNQGKQAVSAVRGEVVFDGVTFRYPDGEADAVRALSLTVRPGETLALVGPSGSGKTTVLNLVVGFIRPTQGRLRLDGRDVETLDLRTYRRWLSVVPQETLLFDGTVRENITYGLASVSLATVQTALRDANALEFVERLPQGLDTLVGERGARLSGGQKQRLAIARALIRDPRVLILDEATSALDTEAEALIQEALERLMRGRTTFVAAHRLSTIGTAGRIAVMEDGRLAELGTHAGLLARGGVYARLYAHQTP